MTLRLVARLAPLAAVLLVSCADAEPPRCFVTASLSQRVLYDKLDFQGPWRHQATVLEGTDPHGIAAGDSTEPRGVVFDFGEDHLWVGDEREALLMFAVESHYDAGFTESGERCLAVTGSTPWYTRRYVSWDYSTDWVGASVRLLSGDASLEVEPLSPLEEDFSESTVGAMAWWEDEPPAMVDTFDLIARYGVRPADCPDCTMLPLRVRHTFTREPFGAP